MLINFYTDPVDVTNVCADLSNGEIVVIVTVRENFRAIAKSVAESIDIDPYSGEVEGSGMSWWYYLAPADEKYTVAETDRFVVQAVEIWDSKGGLYPFSAIV